MTVLSQPEIDAAHRSFQVMTATLLKRLVVSILPPALQVGKAYRNRHLHAMQLLSVNAFLAPFDQIYEKVDYSIIWRLELPVAAENEITKNEFFLFRVGWIVPVRQAPDCGREILFVGTGLVALSVCIARRKLVLVSLCRENIERIQHFCFMKRRDSFSGRPVPEE